MAGPVISQLKRKQIISMKQQGLSQEVIASELSINRSSVYRILKQEGITGVRAKRAANKRKRPMIPFVPEAVMITNKTMVVDGIEVEVLNEYEHTIAVQDGNRTGLWHKSQKKLVSGWRERSNNMTARAWI
ncbi:helix-turn-helix domain-containing protein [uncultured Vagococcus sp.]|uniref:helix-turn-helix domain-containing protein n=1 Tax=uncultured Vagococcus sp. TaxID=189676 RepID=UPI0028D09CEE|nr:helix-turn-helix domain-containing protein [uncultured Vagococcus sp.]